MTRPTAMTGSYLGGTSWLHVISPGVKFAGLAAVMLPVMLFRTPTVLAIAAAIVVLIYRSAGFGLEVAWQQVRPLRLVVVVLIAAHAILGGGSRDAWTSGIVVAGTIVVAVALAALITLTTPVSAMIESMERGLRPLRRLGMNPERVALVLAFTIRAIPVVAALAQQVRDAQRARGVSNSVRAFAVPLVVRSMRHADALGDALIARGLDDPGPAKQPPPPPPPPPPSP